jgi:hypothetical protein
MQEHHKLMGPVDHLTNAEITSAIHYLDPDERKRTGNNAGAIVWPLLIPLAGALIYIIWAYLRTP